MRRPQTPATPAEPHGQQSIPGAEPTSRQAIAARAEKRLRGTKPQKDLGGADTPLFDTHARDQRSLL